MLLAKPRTPPEHWIGVVAKLRTRYKVVLHATFSERLVKAIKAKDVEVLLRMGGR